MSRVQNSKAPKSQGKKPKEDQPPKRNFTTVFSSRVYGASKTMNCPHHVEGFVFFKADAQALDPNNPERALRYNLPRIGNAVVLSQEQMNYICEYLKLTTNSLESKDQPEEQPEDQQEK